jgi:hypothetical protein
MSTFAFASCTLKDPTGNDFLIKVDSIHCPDSVIANVSFDIEFYGTVGFNDCFRFKTFNPKINDKKTTIQTWGTYDNTSDCHEALVLLNGQKLSMRIPYVGTYIIEVSEPNTTILKKLILVKQAPQAQ